MAARRARFQAETSTLSEAQLRFRPGEGAWSIAEVAEHLLHVEREVTRAASKPGVERRGRRRTPREWLRFAAFLAIVRLRLRIKVPEKVASRVTPDTAPDISRVWSDWLGVHVDLARYLDTVRRNELSDMAFQHPIIGPTPVRGLLPFLRQHFDHHMRQVARIRRAPGFPRA